MSFHHRRRQQQSSEGGLQIELDNQFSKGINSQAPKGLTI